MIAMSNLIFLIFGFVVGSFLNCVIYRLEEGKSFLKGRSFCPHCGHSLAWKDLIPLLSFLFLRGKCRYCKKEISFQYPLVELATALSFFFISFTFSGLFIFYYCIIFSLLIAIFVYDLKHMLIPDSLIYSAIVIVIIFNLYQFFIGSYPILNHLYSALGAALFFLSIVLFSKGKAMGVGDIKLAFFMGFFLGFPGIFLALFLAFFFGAIIGIGLIMFKKKELKSEVPFGPFLIAGTVISLFFAEEIINWYLNLFL